VGDDRLHRGVNGATRVVPGSHRAEDKLRYNTDETIGRRDEGRVRSSSISGLDVSRAAARKRERLGTRRHETSTTTSAWLRQRGEPVPRRTESMSHARFLSRCSGFIGYQPRRVRARLRRRTCAIRSRCSDPDAAGAGRFFGRRADALSLNRGRPFPNHPPRGARPRPTPRLVAWTGAHPRLDQREEPGPRRRRPTAKDEGREREHRHGEQAREKRTAPGRPSVAVRPEPAGPSMTAENTWRKRLARARRSPRRRAEARRPRAGTTHLMRKTKRRRAGQTADPRPSSKRTAACRRRAAQAAPGSMGAGPYRRPTPASAACAPRIRCRGGCSPWSGAGQGCYSERQHGRGTGAAGWKLGALADNAVVRGCRGRRRAASGRRPGSAGSRGFAWFPGGRSSSTSGTGS